MHENSGSIKNAFKELDAGESGKVVKHELLDYFSKTALSSEDMSSLYDELADTADSDSNLDFKAFRHLFD